MTEDKEMDKTPEQMAEEYHETQANADGFSVQRAYLAGYKAPQERALRLVDEVQDRLSAAYDNGKFMESEWDHLVMAFDTISTAIRGLK